MPTVTVRRVNGRESGKKHNRWDSMEGHLVNLNEAKVDKAAAEAAVAAFNAEISGIVSEPKKAAINESAFVVRAQAVFADDIDAADAQLIGQRDAINKINNLIQADADYDVDEKSDAQLLKDNEV